MTQTNILIIFEKTTMAKGNITPAKAKITPTTTKTIITIGKTNATKHNIIMATQNTNKIQPQNNPPGLIHRVIASSMLVATMQLCMPAVNLQ